MGGERCVMGGYRGANICAATRIAVLAYVLTHCVGSSVPVVLGSIPARASVEYRVLMSIPLLTSCELHTSEFFSFLSFSAVCLSLFPVSFVLHVERHTLRSLHFCIAFGRCWFHISVPRILYSSSRRTT